MAPRRLGRFTNVTGGEEREKSKEGFEVTPGNQNRNVQH